MMKSPKILAATFCAFAVSVFCLAATAAEPPSADQILTDFRLSQGDKDRVLRGDYVNVKLDAVSERDLTFATVFMCKVSPAELAKEVLAGRPFTVDPQVQAYGMLGAQGSLADLAALHTTPDESRTLSKAEAGDKLNLSTAEIAEFSANPGGAARDNQQQLQRALLARVQAYRSSGLDGIAPYDRGGGRVSNVASDLKLASQSLTALRKYMPALYDVLLDYPKAPLTGIEENFVWLKSNVRGKPTYALAHVLVADGGAARAIARREFYVSTGYNGEQAVAEFLPVDGGTVVVYADHAFTDQVAGAGGSLKRSVGSRVMADTLKAMFDAGRRQLEQSPHPAP